MSEPHPESQTLKLVGYRVQARVLEGTPATVFGKQIITEKWTTLHFVRGQNGIPNPIYSSIADEQGMLTYATALGLMAAVAASEPYGLEFRLEERTLNSTWRIETTGHGETVSFLERKRVERFTPVERADTETDQ